MKRFIFPMVVFLLLVDLVMEEQGQRINQELDLQMGIDLLGQWMMFMFSQGA